MRILKKSKSYRKKYLSQLISQPDGSFKATLVWNNVNIVAVVVLLCIPPAYDMAMLAGLQYNENAADTVKDCHFTLYTVCLFMEINNHAIGYYEFMAVWLLYVSGLFLGLLLFYIFFR